MKLELLKELLCLTQEELWDLLTAVGSTAHTKHIKLGKYIYFKHIDTITTKPLLIAHIDTINDMYEHGLTKDDIEVVNGNIKLTTTSNAHCLGGDDRVGVYCLLEALISELKVDILFTCYEEVGGDGAKAFSDIAIEHSNWSCLIEIDRAGTDHIATYGYDNKELADIIGLDIQYGSYTDLCDIARATGIAGYNIACGYYSQHTNREYIVVDEVEKVLNMLNVELIERLSNNTFMYSKSTESRFSRYDDIEYEYTPTYSSSSNIYDDYDRCEACNKFTNLNNWGFCKECMGEYDYDGEEDERY